MNKPKLVSSPTIRRMRDRQFYKMIIKDAKRILPMVNEWQPLCSITTWDIKMPMLKKIVYRCAVLSPRYKGSIFYGKETRSVHDFVESNTPAWKSDRIFLLNEIIKYCEYKLKEK